MVGRGAPDRGGEIGIAATRAVRICHRVVDQRSGEPAVVTWCRGLWWHQLVRSAQRTGRWIYHDRRNVIAGLVVESELVVPLLTTDLAHVPVDRRFLQIDLGLGLAGHQRRPLRADVEVHQQHAIGDLEARGDRIREVAARLDAVEQAGEDRGSGVLLDRSARAAVAHRVLDLAVRIGDMLLHHHQRLGVQDPVRVEERVGEAVVGDHETKSERAVVVGAGDPRDDPVLLAAELLARLAGGRAEGIEELAVPLRLRRGRRPRRLGRVEQDRDVVDAAVQGAALDPHDVRQSEAGAGGGRGDQVRRRRARAIGLEAREGRRWRRGRRARIRQYEHALAIDAIVDRHRDFSPVEQMEFGRDIALRIDGKGRQAARVRGRRVSRCGDGRGRCADPWGRLRAKQHRAADWMVRDHEACLASAVALAGDEIVATIHQTANQSAQRTRRIGGERTGDVIAVERQPHLVQRHVLRHAHLEQCVAPAHEIGAVRQRHDFEIGRGLSRLRRDQKYRAERQE